MKLEPNHIDDIFRQRLHDTEAPPPEFVWTNVAQELQKRKRRRYFLWLFAFGMAGAGLWAMYAQHDVPAPGQVVLENRQESSSATELQNPPETQQPGPAKSAVVATGLKTESGNQSAKGGNLMPGNSGIPSGQSEEKSVISPLPALDARPDEAANTSGYFAEILPLENTGLEPLAFSRTNTLPQPQLFIRKKKDPKYCYDFAQNPNVWMLDVYAGPSFNKGTLEAADPDYESYAQMRRSTEQPDWSFNAGVRGSLLLGRHFLLRTGLHYEQKTEVFEYADPNYVKYIVEITQTVIDNKPVTVVDTVGVEYGENYVKTYNRYGMLDVPLEIGGEMRRGRFGLSLNAGMSFNVLFWKRGTILSSDGQPVPFTPGEKGATDVFRKRTGWSVSGSAQMFFHLQPTVRVFAEPYYRHTLKPVTLDNQQVEQRNNNWGLKIGLTKILD